MDRIGVPGCVRAARVSRWLVDALAGAGVLWCEADEPRIDAVSLRRLFPSGLTEAQAESYRPLMTAREFELIAPARGRGRRWGR